MTPADGRKYKRAIFIGYVAELKQMGIFEAVRAAASPELAALLDDPRRAPSWLEPGPLDEVIAAVGRLRGRNACRELGFNVMKHGFTSVLEPIIHLSLSVIGGGPGSLYSRAQMMVSVTTRGIEMKWKPTAPTSGTVRISSVDVMQDFAWAAWEGTLVYGLELAGVDGTVAPARCEPGGKSCDVDIAWNKGKRES